jgi:hypothetical protein
MTFENVCQTGFAAPASAKLDPRLPTPDDLTIYVGAGCFWHVQHEMIVAEQKILGRGKSTFTAVVGYAGGTKVGQENKANTPTTRKVIVRDFA